MGRVNHLGAVLCSSCPAAVKKLLSMPFKSDNDRSRKTAIAPCTSSLSGYMVLQPTKQHIVKIALSQPTSMTQC